MIPLKINLLSSWYSWKFARLSLCNNHSLTSLVVGFTTTYAISTYHHYCCEFESRSCRGVLDITSCDKVYQWLATGRCFSPVPHTYEIECRNITEILLKVALRHHNHNPNLIKKYNWSRILHNPFSEHLIIKKCTSK